MDALIADDPKLYDQYAVRDAEISAKHVSEMLKFQREHGLGSLPVPTLGSLAVKYLLKFWKDEGISADAVNGATVKNLGKGYVQDSGKWFTRKEVQHHPHYEQWEALAKHCYHGGRNECFSAGPTAPDEGPWTEFDLNGAYTTAMSTIQMLDYDKSLEVNSAFVMTPPSGLGG